MFYIYLRGTTKVRASSTSGCGVRDWGFGFRDESLGFKDYGFGGRVTVQIFGFNDKGFQDSGLRN